MSRKILCAAILAAQSTSVAAADAQGRYAAGYPATLGCTEVTDAAEGSKTLFAVAAFTEGWFAAHAKLTPGVFDYTPWQSIEYQVAQLRAFCGANPESTLGAGLNALTAFFAPDAMEESEQPKSVSNGEQAIFVYPSVLQRIQAQLRARGFATEEDADPVTGLADFQRSAGVPASGLPDQITLQKLFSDQAEP